MLASGECGQPSSGMIIPPASGFDSVLERMYVRQGVDTLPAHVEATYEISVTKVSELDVGVFRIDRGDKKVPLVARLFSAARPVSAANADLEVLRYLAGIDFPAERPIAERPLSSHDGQALLLTEFVKEVPRAKRPPHPIVKLGRMIARLHRLPVPAGADRPAGALHHFAEGTMSDELRAVSGWLASIEPSVPSGCIDGFDALRDAVVNADGGDGLPEGFVHPDPVPKNVIFTGDGPVLVDWTSAGRGPRLASMTLVLRSGWAAVPFMKGYLKVSSLTDDEWARLPGLLFSRQLIGLAFGVCRDPKTAAKASAKRLDSLRRQCEAKAEEVRNR